MITRLGPRASWKESGWSRFQLRTAVRLSSTKEARIYIGKKIAFLTSGAGKIGQPLVKE